MGWGEPGALAASGMTPLPLLQDGTFLVRDCSARSCTEPFVLVVFHGHRVYNVKIRFLESSGQFALGTGLRGDEVGIASRLPFSAPEKNEGGLAGCMHALPVG